MRQSNPGRAGYREPAEIAAALAARKVTTARKPGYCRICFGMIRMGEMYRQSGVTLKAHERCIIAQLEAAGV